MRFVPALLAVLIFALPARASAPEAPILPQEAPENIGVLIHSSAVKYAISERLLSKMIDCESGFDPSAIGDNGTSFGIAQLHHPSEWGVTPAEALDPKIAIPLMARAISHGLAYKWTCYALISKTTAPS